MDHRAAARRRAARPDWHFVMIGPVVKIDPASCPRCRTSTTSAQDVRGAAALHRRLGRRDPAVRAERVDALHQPDQDAGVPGRRQAGRVDVDPRRGASVWRTRARPDRRRRARVRRARCEAAMRRRRARRGRRSADAFLATTSWDAPGGASTLLVERTSRRDAAASRRRCTAHRARLTALVRTGRLNV